MAGAINPAGPRAWSAERVHALAPDAASRSAGAKLATPGPWSGCGARTGADLPGLVWGDCRGSGAKPYQVTVELPEGQGTPGYACSCPSRKFPCKHALGLLLLWSGGAVPESDEVPPRVEEWLAGRRERAERGEARRVAQERKAEEAAAGAADADGDGPADKTAQAAQRRAAQRIGRIDAGLDDLELWLRDRVRSGLTSLRAGGYRPIDDLARRLVDAQAPGVATRVRGLTVCLSTAEDWPERTLTELSLLHLLIQGWRNRDSLPEPLAATVRRRVGLSMTAAQIAASGEHVADRWLVLGSRDLAADKLVERRIWLQAQTTGRLAVLLAFAPPGQAFALALPVGAVLDAELAFTPDAAPLRAVIVEQRELTTDPAAAFAPQGGTLDDAAAAFAATLAADPWTTAVPVVVDSAVPVVGAGTREWQIADTPLSSKSSDVTGGGRVPLLAQADGVDPNRADLIRYGLLASGGGHPAPLFGLYRNGGLTPITVWSDGRAASL